eukprot:Rhum_TRINITY_DN14814_c7_g1::Rhum_TRINITY_DN14814_c7_g1_i1::g.121625::m.121625
MPSTSQIYTSAKPALLALVLEAGHAAHMARNYTQGFVNLLHAEILAVDTQCGQVEARMRDVAARLREGQEIAGILAAVSSAAEFMQKVLKPDFLKDKSLSMDTRVKLMVLISVLLKSARQMSVVAAAYESGLAAAKACRGKCPCGFAVTGVHPTRCCNRCDRQPGAHGPRCKQVPYAAAAAAGAQAMAAAARVEVKRNDYIAKHFEPSAAAKAEVRHSIRQGVDTIERRRLGVALGSWCSNEAHLLQEAVADRLLDPAAKQASKQIINVAGQAENESRKLVAVCQKHGGLPPKQYANHLEKLKGHVDTIRSDVSQAGFPMREKHAELKKHLDELAWLMEACALCIFAPAA